eukprot:gnl/TRDRNA2_/TRDRNA2_170147_c2_seq3.p1 gnl/TRDRNA2_/TRDRNA2_170147_c2~~gnl/TRDRNA2_/TRDRNA2_170147_c2_seq3.p1  ORF type:complete len:467 (+),score=80.63 gnl/TRDRNA2_/TRDRNA2_170147_c2_seq3:169-1401(+)
MPGSLWTSPDDLRKLVSGLVAKYEIEREADVFGLGPHGNAESPEQWLLDTMSSDFAFLAAVALAAERFAQPEAAAHVYRYQFNGYDAQGDAFHAAELQLLQGEDKNSKRGSLSVRHAWIESWVAFVCSGDPNTPAMAGAWRPYSDRDRPVMFWDGVRGWQANGGVAMARRTGLHATVALWEELWLLGLIEQRSILGTALQGAWGALSGALAVATTVADGPVEGSTREGNTSCTNMEAVAPSDNTASSWTAGLGGAIGALSEALTAASAPTGADADCTHEAREAGMPPATAALSNSKHEVNGSRLFADETSATTENISKPRKSWTETMGEAVDALGQALSPPIEALGVMGTTGESAGNGMRADISDNQTPDVSSPEKAEALDEDTHRTSTKTVDMDALLQLTRRRAALEED